MEVYTILDTTVSDSGAEQQIDEKFLRENKPLRFHCDLGAGDTVVIYGRGNGTMPWSVLYTFTDETPKDIYPSYLMKADRTVDGGSQDSKIYVEDPHQSEFISLVNHE